MLGRELQKRSPTRQSASDRDCVEGDVDGPGLRSDGADVLFHCLLVKRIDLRCLGDSAPPDDVCRNRFHLAKVASTQKELRALPSERAPDSAANVPSGSVDHRNLVLQNHLWLLFLWRLSMLLISWYNHALATFHSRRISTRQYDSCEHRFQQDLPMRRRLVPSRESSQVERRTLHPKLPPLRVRHVSVGA